MTESSHDELKANTKFRHFTKESTVTYTGAVPESDTALCPCEAEMIHAVDVKIELPKT